MEFFAQHCAIEELQLPNGWPSVEPTLVLGLISHDLDQEM